MKLRVVQGSVLAPIGMTHSTYQQPLPAEMRANAATPYDVHGKPIPGGAHTYPELAAAGLWTTPTDLALYAIEIQHSLKGEWNHVLSQQTTRQMLTKGLGDYGLGLSIGGSETAPHFGHGGVNEGFESMMMAYEQSGEGAVVMTNAQGGSRLADEVMRSIAAVYHWPDLQPKIRTAVSVDPKTLAAYVGTYELAPTLSIVVTAEGGHLVATATGQDSFPMFAESKTKFFTTTFDAEIEFHEDDRGNVSYLLVRQSGNETKANKK